MSVFPSIHLQETTQLPLDRFSLNLIIFLKISIKFRLHYNLRRITIPYIKSCVPL
jgi:hypothetical protein